MARLRPLELHEVDEEIRAICHESERSSGTSASARTLAHHPPAVKALTGRGTPPCEVVPAVTPIHAPCSKSSSSSRARATACQKAVKSR